MKELDARAKTIKLLEENIRVNLCDLEFNNGFLDMTPKAQATKEKIDKLVFIKIKNFIALKDTVKRVKKQNGKKYLQIMYPPIV